jgi:hypothetical protein
VRWSGPAATTTDQAPAAAASPWLEQSFRLVEGYTFGHLLHDVLEHFGLTHHAQRLAAPPSSGNALGVDESPRSAAGHHQPGGRFELRDAEGSVWPLLARVEYEMTEDDFAHAATEQQQGCGDESGRALSWPVVCLVETGSLGRRLLAKASKKKASPPSLSLLPV